MANEKQLVVNLALKSGTMKQQINSINKDIKQMQTDFKNAGAGVEDFEKTSEGLSTKLKLQQSVVEKLKDKLSVYKSEQEKCTATLDKAVSAYQKQEQKVKSLEQALEQAKQEYGENSEEVKELEDQLKKASKALETKRNSVINANNSLTTMNTTISSTEAEIKAMEAQISQTASALDELENGASEASDEVEELGESLEEAGENSVDFNSKLSLIGQGMTELGDKATEAGKKVLDVIGDLVESGSEYSAEVAGTEFILNNLDSTTKELINNNSKLSEVIGLTNKQYKDNATNIANYYKNMGLTTDETNTLTESTMNLVADLAAITDLPFDESLSAFKSALQGNYEAVDKFGVNISATTLAQTEFVQSLDKSWDSLSNNEKIMAIYNEVARQSASATGLASQEAQEFGMKSKYLSTRLEEVKGTIGEKLLPVLQPLMEKIADIVEKVAKWVEDNPELTRTILIIVGALGAFLAIMGPIISFLGTLTLAVMAFNVATLPVTGTVLLVVGAITALIAIVALMIVKWDEIVECWNSFCEWSKQLWSNFTNWITTKFTEIKDKTVTKVQEMKEGAINKFTEIKTSATNKIQEMKDSVVNKFNEIKNNIATIIDNIKNGISTWASNVKTSVSNAFSNLYDTITSPFKRAWSYISGIGDKISGVISKINPFKRLARGIEATITPAIDTYGISPLSLDNVALSGSYYNANSRASLNANDMIRQANLSSYGNDTMISMMFSVLGEITKAIQNLNTNNKGEIALYTTNKTYLDSKLIINETTKQVIKNIDKGTNNYRIVRGRN
ncbi:phage tail tape measure protein [Clostridium cuniculi]|uniref:phage tail tape measure protein n=1 Tax=Clostridium cuniculi TaxID=2548455 RepID=UPI0010557633|nr:phage tail tape measure protein [Clostridium cuniculi]